MTGWPSLTISMDRRCRDDRGRVGIPMEMGDGRWEMAEVEVEVEVVLEVEMEVEMEGVADDRARAWGSSAKSNFGPTHPNLGCLSRSRLGSMCPAAADLR